MFLFGVMEPSAIRANFVFVLIQFSPSFPIPMLIYSSNSDTSKVRGYDINPTVSTFLLSIAGIKLEADDESCKLRIVCGEFSTLIVYI